MKKKMVILFFISFITMPTIFFAVPNQVNYSQPINYTHPALPSQSIQAPIQQKVTYNRNFVQTEIISSLQKITNECMAIFQDLLATRTIAYDVKDANLQLLLQKILFIKPLLLQILHILKQQFNIDISMKNLKIIHFNQNNRNKNLLGMFNHQLKKIENFALATKHTVLYSLLQKIRNTLGQFSRYAPNDGTIIEPQQPTAFVNQNTTQNNSRFANKIPSHPYAVRSIR